MIDGGSGLKGAPVLLRGAVTRLLSRAPLQMRPGRPARRTAGCRRTFGSLGRHHLYRPPFLTKKFRRWLSSLPDPLVFTLDGQRMTYVRSGQGVTVTGTTADQTDRFQYLLDTAAAALGLAVPVTDPVPLANHLLRQSWERTAPASWRHRARHQHARMLRQIR